MVSSGRTSQGEAIVAARRVITLSIDPDQCRADRERIQIDKVGYLRATGLLLLFVVGVAHSAALAPLAPLTDTLALGSAAPGPFQHSAQRRFHYGWLHGAGSAAFICGTLLSGQAISRFGITAAVWLNAGLLAATGRCRSSSSGC